MGNWAHSYSQKSLNYENYDFNLKNISDHHHLAVGSASGALPVVEETQYVIKKPPPSAHAHHGHSRARVIPSKHHYVNAPHVIYEELPAEPSYEVLLPEPHRQPHHVVSHRLRHPGAAYEVLRPHLQQGLQQQQQVQPPPRQGRAQFINPDDILLTSAELAAAGGIGGISPRINPLLDPQLTPAGLLPPEAAAAAAAAAAAGQQLLPEEALLLAERGVLPPVPEDGYGPPPHPPSYEPPYQQPPPPAPYLPHPDPRQKHRSSHGYDPGPPKCAKGSATFCIDDYEV